MKYFMLLLVFMKKGKFHNYTIMWFSCIKYSWVFICINNNKISQKLVIHVLTTKIIFNKLFLCMYVMYQYVYIIYQNCINSEYLCIGNVWIYTSVCIVDTIKYISHINFFQAQPTEISSK